MLYSDKERTLAIKKNHECFAIISIWAYFLVRLHKKAKFVFINQRGVIDKGFREAVVWLSVTIKWV